MCRLYKESWNTDIWTCVHTKHIEMLCNPAICTCFPTYRLHNANCCKYYILCAICTCSLTYRLHIEKQPEGLYIHVPIYEMSINPVICTCFTYRIHNTKQPRRLYICICANHTKCKNFLRYVPVLHTDYIIKNSQKGLYICAGYMEVALCNPAICTCLHTDYKMWRRKLKKK